MTYRTVAQPQLPWWGIVLSIVLGLALSCGSFLLLRWTINYGVRTEIQEIRTEIEELREQQEERKEWFIDLGGRVRNLQMQDYQFQNSEDEDGQ